MHAALPIPHPTLNQIITTININYILLLIIVSRELEITLGSISSTHKLDMAMQAHNPKTLEVDRHKRNLGYIVSFKSAYAT